MLTLPDLALQVGEEEAGVGQGGVGGAVVGVVLAPRLLPASHPASCLLINVGQEIQHIVCPADVGFNNRAAAGSAWPRGVLADAVDAAQGGVAGGEETQVLTSSNSPGPKCVTWVQAELSRQS